MSKLLLPFSFLYGFGMWLRNWCYDHNLFTIESVDVPVISVGNMTAGGTGKTPMVEYLVQYCLNKGKRVAVLSRGYKRLSNGTVAVGAGDLDRGNAAMLGDEPFQISRKYPQATVIVESKRVRSAKLAREKYRADVILLDDGFQHRALKRDVDIVMVSGNKVLEEEPMLPAGLRREPLNGLRRANIVAFSGAQESMFLQAERRRSLASVFNPPFPPRRTQGDGLFAFETTPRGSNLPKEDRNDEFPLIIETKTSPVALHSVLGKQTIGVDSIKGKRCIAFSGIANPERFHQTLVSLGLIVEECIRYPDHHMFSQSEVQELENAWNRHKPEYIITTEKDAVRLQSMVEKGTILNSSLYYLAIEMQVTKGEAEFHNYIDSIILNVH